MRAMRTGAAGRFPSLFFRGKCYLSCMSEVPNVSTIILNWNGLAESNWIAINDLTALIAGKWGPAHDERRQGFQRPPLPLVMESVNL